MNLQIKIIGALFILVAILHVFFPGYFNWKKDLAPLSLINRQMMQVHLFFIAFGVFLIGLLCLTSSDMLLHTILGKRISLGLGIFWTVRLFFQLFVYSARLWKGKRFETMVHTGFSIIWAYVSIVFLLCYLAN